MWMLPGCRVYCVYPARLEGNEAKVKAGIVRLLIEFKDRRVQVFWTSGPSDRPRGILILLRPCGLMHIQQQRGMAVELEGLSDRAPVDGLNIVRMETKEQPAEYLKCMLEALSWPAHRWCDPERYGSHFLDGAGSLRRYI